MYRTLGCVLATARKVEVAEGGSGLEILRDLAVETGGGGEGRVARNPLPAQWGRVVDVTAPLSRLPTLNISLA